MAKKAVITGVTGQDGSYLAELLLDKKYEVFGVVRRTSAPTTERIEKILNNKHFHLVPGDITDTVSLMTIIRDVQPDEVYNLASHSFVHASWDEPLASGEYTAMSVSKILDAVRLFQPKAHFYQASSSEMFGKVREVPQTELTPFYPRSPYGVAKAFGHFITVNYRESYDMFACSGILFNHESPRRGLEFVTRKIAHQVAQVKLGEREYVELGNLEAKRDWGYSKDYVEAMWLMLQQDKPDDFVIATGETHTVREFLECAFRHVGIDDWEKHFKHNPEFDRPAEVDLLIGNPAKAKKVLGWKPSVTFGGLVKIMVDAELAILQGKARMCDF